MKTELHNQVIKLYEIGITQREIGKRFGISFQRVQQILAYNGIYKNKHSMPISYKEYMSNMAKKKYAKNRDKILDRQHKWYIKNIDRLKEYYKKRHKETYPKNRDTILKKQKERYQKMKAINKFGEGHCPTCGSGL